YRLRVRGVSPSARPGPPAAVSEMLPIGKHGANDYVSVPKIQAVQDHRPGDAITVVVAQQRMRLRSQEAIQRNTTQGINPRRPAAIAYCSGAPAVIQALSLLSCAAISLPGCVPSLTC